MKSIINKKAYHDYEILELFEAGIILHGYEIKSARAHHVQLKGNFVMTHHGELFAEGIHIGKYKYASNQDINPTRSRKLLLHRKEISKIIQAVAQKGVTCIVLDLYMKGNLLKAKIGIVRGKKLHDKRESLKRKDEKRHMEKVLKKYTRG